MAKILVELPGYPDEVLTGTFATVEELQTAVASVFSISACKQIRITSLDEDFNRWVNVSPSVLATLHEQPKWRLRAELPPVLTCSQETQTDAELLLPLLATAAGVEEEAEVETTNSDPTETSQGIVARRLERALVLASTLRIPNNPQEALELGSQKLAELQEKARVLAAGTRQRFTEGGVEGVARAAQGAVVRAAQDASSRISELAADPKLAMAKDVAMRKAKQHFPSLAAAMLQVILFAATFKQLLDKSRNKAAPLSQRLLFECLEVAGKSLLQKQGGTTLSIGPFRVPIARLPVPAAVSEDAATVQLPDEPQPRLDEWAEELVDDLRANAPPSEAVPYPLTKAGKLYKKGDHGGFRLRHFELRGPYLYYFLPEVVPDSGDVDKALKKGVISMLSTDVKREAIPKLGISIGGKMLTRRYVLEAQTEEDCVAWLDILTATAKRWATVAAPVQENPQKFSKLRNMFTKST